VDTTANKGNTGLSMKEQQNSANHPVGNSEEAKSDKRYRFRNLYRELNEELLRDSWPAAQERRSFRR